LIFIISIHIFCYIFILHWGTKNETDQKLKPIQTKKCTSQFCYLLEGIFSSVFKT
jgi:hypothetical protein